MHYRVFTSKHNYLNQKVIVYFFFLARRQTFVVDTLAEVLDLRATMGHPHRPMWPSVGVLHTVHRTTLVYEQYSAF